MRFHAYLEQAAGQRVEPKNIHIAQRSYNCYSSQVPEGRNFLRTDPKSTHPTAPRGSDFRSLQFAENIKRLPPWIYLRISKTTNMFTFDQAFACFAFIHHMHLTSHIDLSLHHIEYEFVPYGLNSSQTCVSKLMFAILTF